MNDAVPFEPPLLEVRDLTVRYGESVAVRNVPFRLQPGEALGIVGESGSGKSSIAGAILDFLGPAARINGQILFQGQDLTQLSRNVHRAVLGRRIGSVFQDPFPRDRHWRPLLAAAGSQRSRARCRVRHARKMAAYSHRAARSYWRAARRSHRR